VDGQGEGVAEVKGECLKVKLSFIMKGFFIECNKTQNKATDKHNNRIPSEAERYSVKLSIKTIK
jgi:hypothetical protein